MKKHKLHIDRTTYERKPTAQEVKQPKTGINDRITMIAVEVTIAALALAISQGQTWIASYIEGIRNNQNCKSQSVFALDFDNSEMVNDSINPASNKKVKTQVENPISPQQVIGRLKEYGLDCCLIYYSFSHSEEWQRFRVVFQTEETFTDMVRIKQIQDSLLMLFPEADKCRDACRIWYGTNKSFCYQNYDSYLDTERLVENSIIFSASRNGTSEYDKSNVARRIKAGISKLKSDENGECSLYIEDNTQNSSKFRDSKILNKSAYRYFLEMSQYSSVYNEILKKGYLENVDFELIAQKVKILADFMNPDVKLDHETLKGLATNLYWIKGGQALYRKCIDANPSYSQDKHTIMSYCMQVQYIPMYLERFSKYEEDFQYTNIIQAAKLPRAEIYRKRHHESISLAEAEAKCKDEVNQSLNEEGNFIYLIKKATGLGGTENLLSQEDAAIALPNHTLKEEVSNRFKVDHEITPELFFDLMDEGLKAKIKYLYGVGAINKVNRILQEESLRNLEIRKYLDDSAKAYGSKKTVLTTHTKALFVDFEHDTLIFDEDPLTSILEIGEVTLNDLNNLLHKLGESPDREKLESYIKILTSPIKEDQEMLVKTDFSDIDLIEDIVLDSNDFDSNILKFIRSDFFIQDDQSQSSLRFIKHNSLNSDLLLNKKIIIISATVNEFIYRKLYGDRVKFIDISNVEMEGIVVQDTQYSYSRSSLRQAGVRNYVEQKASDFDYLVTFKQYKHYFKNSVGDIYYGKCAGFDKLKGKRIAVVGTPHLKTVDYLLYARALGIQENLNNLHLQHLRVEHNGFEFRFRTFPTKELQLIQFHFIEEQMIQAIGRARTLREPVEAILFSNYPLPFALFTENEINQGRKKLEQRKEDSFKEKELTFVENDEAPITSSILVDTDFLLDVHSEIELNTELYFQSNQNDQIEEIEFEEVANLLD